MVKSRLDALTPQERLVTRWVANGIANKLIAYYLNISESTVKVHITNAMKKLKKTNRTQLAILSSDDFIEKVAKGEFQNPTQAALSFIQNNKIDLKAVKNG